MLTPVKHVQSDITSCEAKSIYKNLPCPECVFHFIYVYTLKMLVPAILFVFICREPFFHKIDDIWSGKQIAPDTRCVLVNSIYIGCLRKFNWGQKTSVSDARIVAHTLPMCDRCKSTEQKMICMLCFTTPKIEFSTWHNHKF